jgi:FlaA1/EpsC-like NDP-sugar epimerase
VRELALQAPASLLLIDASEQNLFELHRKAQTLPAPETDMHFVLGNVGDASLLESLFEKFRPEFVFHAAAFKHVALLERNPFAAIQNNALGTYTLVQTALRQNISNLLVISTDKAVNPRSVMGVSKRLAELFCVSSSAPPSLMSAIRLGNVFGSTGSVVPLFIEQLNQGQPLTVTDAGAARYFISPEQAVSTILAAATACCDGKILLPDMGSPVRIIDLARSVTRSMGSHDGNVAMRFTGLHPGEKLIEELIADNEQEIACVSETLKAIETPKLSLVECEKIVDTLSNCVRKRNLNALLSSLCSAIPEYTPSPLLVESAAASSSRQ